MSRIQIYRAVISVLGMLVCALGVALFVVLNRQPDAPPARPVRETAAAPAIPAPVPFVFPSAANPLPSVAASLPPFAPKPVDIVRLQALQKKFETLSVQGEPNIAEVDALLNELIEIQGSSVIAGVDLNVVRQNLRIAGDLQQVAKEMEAEQKASAPDAARLENLRQRAAALQNQLTASLQGRPVGAAPGAPFAPSAGTGSR
jgi:hypothetical protein